MIPLGVFAPLREIFSDTLGDFFAADCTEKVLKCMKITAHFYGMKTVMSVA